MTIETSRGEPAPAPAVGLGRIATHSFGPACVDYLVYRYLVPCIEQVGARSRGRLLDLGCGNKPYRSLFPHVTTYLGCDVTQSSARVVDVVCRADKVSLRGEAFDVVLCTQTIEHVADYMGLLREACRLLKPGGTLYLSGPMYWYLHEEPFDFHRFTGHGFRHSLENAGFIVEAVEPNGGKWSVLGLVLLHTLPPWLTRQTWFTRIINGTFSWLDERHFDSISTSNYFVIAHRRPS